MKIICVNNANNENVLTVGKIYHVILTYSPYYYRVKNDHNVTQNFYQHRFLNLKEQRKEKIQRIENSI